MVLKAKVVEIKKGLVRVALECDVDTLHKEMETNGALATCSVVGPMVEVGSDWNTGACFAILKQESACKVGQEITLGACKITKVGKAAYEAMSAHDKIDYLVKEMQADVASVGSSINYIDAYQMIIRAHPKLYQAYRAGE